MVFCISFSLFLLRILLFFFRFCSSPWMGGSFALMLLLSSSLMLEVTAVITVVTCLSLPTPPLIRFTVSLFLPSPLRGTATFSASPLFSSFLALQSFGRLPALAWRASEESLRIITFIGAS